MAELAMVRERGTGNRRRQGYGGQDGERADEGREKRGRGVLWYERDIRRFILFPLTSYLFPIFRKPDNSRVVLEPQVANSGGFTKDLQDGKHNDVRKARRPLSEVRGCVVPLAPAYLRVPLGQRWRSSPGCAEHSRALLDRHD